MSWGLLGHEVSWMSILRISRIKQNGCFCFGCCPVFVVFIDFMFDWLWCCLLRSLLVQEGTMPGFSMGVLVKGLMEVPPTGCFISESSRHILLGRCRAGQKDANVASISDELANV
jgi:hypothetical protein